MSRCDIFVSLDSVEFPNRGINHRNKIRTKEGWDWLTIPIEKKCIGNQIREVKLPQDTGWWKKHWNTIIANYSKSAFFSEYKGFFEDLYREKRQEKLQDLNEAIILHMAEIFLIKPKFLRASELDLDFSLHKTDFILDILHTVGCTTYITGTGGSQTFLDVEEFKKTGIEVNYLKVDTREYRQRFSGFEPYMSAIDVLFNINAEKGREYIDTVLTELPS